MIVRLARIEDADAIREIYNLEVETGTATFDLESRTIAEQREWLTDRSGAHAVVVAELEHQIVGFGALSRYKPRAAYNTTVEDSVYVAPAHQGRGIGRLLLEDLVNKATEHGFHTVIARIGHESEGSIRIHAAVGFAEIGRELQVGRKFGRWIDVVVMQRMLV
ncbi:MAG: GNAT family N-acetyltransferase [Acidimicrobiales bacterium]